MPGAYHFDGPNPSGQALNAGIFRPPVSPSASSSVYNLAKSTGSLYSDISAANTPLSGAKRKRARADKKREPTPMADWTTNMDGAADGREDDRLNGEAAQTRYTLAGQIDIPGDSVRTAENGMLEESVYSDIDYRRALGSKRQRDDVDSPAARLSSLHIDPDTVRSPGSAGWSTVAINTIGEVVGKMWEFCRTGGFRGFHAGGGQGYEFNGATATGSRQTGTQWCNEHDIPTLQTGDVAQTGAQVPGYFPQSDYMPYMPDVHEMTTPETTPVPSAKRRHLNEPTDELRRNWVLINEPPPHAPDQGRKKAPLATTIHRAATRSKTGLSQTPRYSAPTSASSGRRISVPVSRLSGGVSTPTKTSSRASLRISHAGSPSLSARSPASFAPPRSPPIRSPTPTAMATTTTTSRIPVPAHQPGVGPNPFAPGAAAVATGAMGSRPSSRQSRVSSPTTARAFPPSHRRNHSSASSASGAAPATAAVGTGPAASGADASPRLDAEAKHLAQRKVAAERDADARMEAFNKRLMDMIRQGKEALGTTVEVEMEDGGGGWEDEE